MSSFLNCFLLLPALFALVANVLRNHSLSLFAVVIRLLLVSKLWTRHLIWFSWFLVNMRLSMSCGYYWCWGRLRRNRLGILLQIGAASLTDGERNDKRPSYAFPVAHSAHCVAILLLDPLSRSSPILPFDVRVHFTSESRWIFILFFDCLHDLCTEVDFCFPSVLYIYISRVQYWRERGAAVLVTFSSEEECQKASAGSNIDPISNT